MNSNISNRTSTKRRTEAEESNKQRPTEGKPLVVRYPLLWLSVAALCVYLPILGFGYTDLDDGMIINGEHWFNEKLGNIISSFHKSVMPGVAGDIYYRPIHNVSLILNNQLSGQAIGGYHFVNILLHIGAVCALYKLLLKLNIKPLHSFLLSLAFAVHPVFVMAVAWVPGRIETLPAIFSFLFLSQTIEYSDTGKPRALLLSALYLLLALFSKESAVFLLPVAAVLLVVYRQRKWNDKSNMVQYGVWFLCFGIWFIMRSISEVAAINLSAREMAVSAIKRMPVLLQYIGKTFLPFDLSVYPNVRDTGNWVGVLSVVLLGAVIYLNKKRDVRTIISGLAIFILLMVPALLIPDYINKQSFEYRLYIPMLGLLLILSQTAILNNRLTDGQLLASGVGVCCVLAALNLRHQKNFESPLAFWTNATETSPHDSYALMMLSARVGDAEQSKALFQRAFALNPKERYVNYLYANMLQEKDSILASEQYLLAEKKITGYPKADLLLSRVAREKHDYPVAIQYAKAYLKSEPADTSGNVNLLILYMEADMDELSVKQANHMDSLSLPIPPIIRSQIKYHQANH